jgi:MFS superfamily sulfate permease-like transporter
MNIPNAANDSRGSLLPGFFPNLRPNLLSGFLVFLIAMPLCLAIARASNFPPIAGIWTAVIGGVICTLLSNSELTIKGPAAGLIVIVAGAVTELGAQFGSGLSEADQMLAGYRLALGIGVASGVIQIFLGICKAGKLGEWFPLTPVHGMLASIGIIIIAKQSYVMLGIAPPAHAEPLGLLLHLPGMLTQLNPAIAVIGIVSLVILFGLPFVPNPIIRRAPAQLLVLIVGIALGFFFELQTPHEYAVGGQTFAIGPKYLVDLPNVLSNPVSAFGLPDYRGLFTSVGWKYVLLFAAIGSLESLLSAKAIDLLDPWKRKTDLNQDLFAVGVANTISALLGGMPMISEIVRSSANINQGARSRYANFFHGIFLLASVLLLPTLIHNIPLAALGAMLIYTGFRLASPKEFIHTWKIGKEQLIVFLVTIVTTLATDLLIGIGVGIVCELALHLLHGVPLPWMFRTSIDQPSLTETHAVVVVRQAAVFANWLGLRAAISRLEDCSIVTVDLTATRMVDHSVMEKLRELEREFSERGGLLNIVGLDDHIPLSSYPTASRKRIGPLPLIPATQV